MIPSLWYARGLAGEKPATARREDACDDFAEVCRGSMAIFEGAGL